MSSRRAAIIFIAAFVAIAGSAWLSSRRHLDRSIMSGELVLPELKARINDVTELHLSKAGGTATTLRKGRDGWEVREREYPADSSKVRKLLLDLAALEVVEEKTRDPANYGAIGVADLGAEHATGTRIDIIAGASTQSILIGNASGMKSGFVRLPNDARSLLATPRPSPDAEAAQWIDKSLFSIPAARIKQASFAGPGGAYSIARDKAETVNFTVSGIPKGRKLASDAAGNASANGLDLLNIDDVRKATPAPADAAHASFTTFDGLVLEATGHAEGERRFISFSAKSTTASQEHEARTLLTRFAGREFEIPSYKYDAIFRPVEELLEKLPEPKAASAKAPAGAHSATAKPPAAAAPALPGPGQ